MVIVVGAGGRLRISSQPIKMIPVRRAKANNLFISTQLFAQATIEWEKSYGGSSFDAGRGITNTADNGYILVGSSRSEDMDVDKNQGQNDMWVVKIDNAGDIEWQNTIGGTNIDVAYSAIESDNQSIIVVGETSSSDGDIPENKGFTDVIIAKIVLE